MHSDDIEELKQQADVLIVENATPSKIRKIREMMPIIDHLLASGVSIELITDFVNKKGIKVTKKYLKNMLHRIRKERKPESKNIEISRQSPPQKETTAKTAPAPQPEKQPLDYQAKIKAFNEVAPDDWKGKYMALGGNPDELKDLSPAGQRNKVVKLRMKLSSENL